jgi:hypothetical protein
MQQQNIKALHRVALLFAALLAWSGVASAQTEWVTVTQPPFKTGVALQLTDGTILVQENKTPHWWILTPDNEGHYNTGTWSMAADMPADYGPSYFASAVLADGRVIVEGGEHNFGAEDNTNKGAIYTPGPSLLGTPAGFWTAVGPPVDEGDIA